LEDLKREPSTMQIKHGTEAPIARKRGGEMPAQSWRKVRNVHKCFLTEYGGAAPARKEAA